MDSESCVVGCLFDLSKAFDCVDPVILMETTAALGITVDSRLSKINGITEAALDWMDSYLLNRTQIIEIDFHFQHKHFNIPSDSLDVTLGVP